MAAGIFFKGRQLLQSSTEIEYGGDAQALNTTTSVIIPDNNDLCEHIDTKYSIAISIICAMCFIFGIIYTFFGKELLIINLFKSFGKF